MFVTETEFQNYDCARKVTQCEATAPLPSPPPQYVKEYKCKANICKTVCEKGYLK